MADLNLTKFRTGTLAAYDALATKDASTVYLITDEGSSNGAIYKGDVKLGGKLETVIVNALPSETPTEANTNKIYFVPDGTSSEISGVEWDSLSYMATDGSDTTSAYTDTFKGYQVTSGAPAIVNIQSNESWGGVGIYCTEAVAITGVSGLESTDYHIEGAGLFVLVNSLTNLETKVTITLADSATHELWLYNRNGVAPATVTTYAEYIAIETSTGVYAWETLGSGEKNIITEIQVDSTTVTPVDGVVNIDLSGKADAATTLAGYGITDAKIENGTITLGSNTITPLTEHQSLEAYVLKELGKGLSTNDYTNADKAIVDGVTTALAGKADASTTYTKTGVDTAISTAVSSVYKVKGTKTVAEINALADMVVGDVYNVSDSGTINSQAVSAGDNVVYTSNGWDKLAASVDLSAYVTTTAMNAALATKANSATTLAGYGITDAKIENGTITLGTETITPITSTEGFEVTSNKVTTLDETATDTQYASAKAVYDVIVANEYTTALAINTLNSTITALTARIAALETALTLSNISE